MPKRHTVAREGGMGGRREHVNACAPHVDPHWPSNPPTGVNPTSAHCGQALSAASGSLAGIRASHPHPQRIPPLLAPPPRPRTRNLRPRARLLWRRPEMPKTALATRQAPTRVPGARSPAPPPRAHPRQEPQPPEPPCECEPGESGSRGDAIGGAMGLHRPELAARKAAGSSRACPVGTPGGTRPCSSASASGSPAAAARQLATLSGSSVQGNALHSARAYCSGVQTCAAAAREWGPGLAAGARGASAAPAAAPPSAFCADVAPLCFISNLIQGETDHHERWGVCLRVQKLDGRCAAAHER